MEFYKVKCWPLTSILIFLNRNLFPAEKSSESLQCLIDFHAKLLIQKPFPMMVMVRSYCKVYLEANWAVSPRLAEALGELLWVSDTFCLQHWLSTNAAENMGHENGNLGRCKCPFGIVPGSSKVHWGSADTGDRDSLMIMLVFAVGNKDLENLHTCLFVKTSWLRTYLH